MAGSLLVGLKRDSPLMGVNWEHLLPAVENHVRASVTHSVTGHDWDHVLRVCGMARYIGEGEGADLHVTHLIALMHDLDDHKFSGSRSGPARAARRLLHSLGAPGELVRAVMNGVAAISYSTGYMPDDMSVEAQCVRDADRLDAMGAVGVARAFGYGGWAGNSLFVATDINPSTVDHFFDKLLRLNAGLVTVRGRSLGEERHAFLVRFLDQLATELAPRTDLTDRMRGFGDNEKPALAHESESPAPTCAYRSAMHI